MARFVLLMVFALFAVLPARAEGAVVIAVTNGGDAISVGDEIAADAVFAVPAEATVTLLRQDGEVVRIVGPFSGVVETSKAVSADDPEWNALTIFLTGSDTSDPALGAARRPDANAGLPGQPTVWQISVDSSGPRCVRPGPVELWRRNAGEPAQVTVRTDADRLSGVMWPAADNGLVLPETFAVADGRMIVSLDDAVRTLSVAVAPRELGSAPPGRVLVWLIDNKCTRQARTLVDALHAGKGAATLAGAAR